MAVGYGFTPQTELPVQLGCEMALDGDGSLVVRVDDAQASTVEGVFVAGEACGVGGAELAVAEGEIAGASAASVTGHAVATSRAAKRRRSAGRAFATAMHEAFAVPAGWRAWLTRDTVVCRCEEVTAGPDRRRHRRPRRRGRADGEAAGTPGNGPAARAACAATRRRASSQLLTGAPSPRRTSPPRRRARSPSRCRCRCSPGLGPGTRSPVSRRRRSERGPPVPGPTDA